MFNREHSNPKEEDNPSRCKWNRQVSEKSQEAGHVATSKDVEHGLHMLIFQPLKAWSGEETKFSIHEIQHVHIYAACTLGSWSLKQFQTICWWKQHAHSQHFQSSGSSPVIWYLIQSSMLRRCGRFPPRCGPFCWFRLSDDADVLMPLFQELDWFQQMQANMGNELANMEMCCFFFFAQPDMRFFP